LVVPKKSEGLAAFPLVFHDVLEAGLVADEAKVPHTITITAVRARTRRPLAKLMVPPSLPGKTPGSTGRDRTPGASAAARD
jgi:hypothetical protein